MNTEERRLELLPSLLLKYAARPACGLAASVGVSEFDDCAVVSLDSERDLVIGSDFVRGEGFLLFKKRLLTRRDVGYYLIGANASDIAAMGARPMGIVVAYRYGKETTDQDYAEVMEGVATACADFQMPLLGGDSGSHETPVLSAAAFGICKRGTGLLRAGGRAGDRLFLTGTVGLAGAAYAYFKAESKSEGRLTEDEIAVLLAPWRRVEPALQQGASLAETGCSRCAIDTSDGLLVSAARLASASGVDVVISEQSIPTHPAVDHVAEILGIPPRVLACGVSVDFRLLFSSPPERCQELKSLFDANRWPLFEVGYMRTAEAEPSVYFETVTGTRVAQESDYFG